MMVTLVAASGSPGVTTTGVGLARHWPRPVILVEADPTGGSGILAGHFRAQVDQPGLVDLVIAQRSDLLAEALPRLLLPIEHTNASVLVGVRSPDQAAGVAQLWTPLLDALRALATAGTDVIVDGGRLGLNGWPQPLVMGSDLTLMLVTSDLVSLAAARWWADSLVAAELPGHTNRLVVVGEGRPYGAREVGRTLGVPVLASIEHAPEHARVYSHGATSPEPRWWRRVGRRGDAAVRAFEGSAYVRSIEAAGGAIRAMCGAEVPGPFRSVLAHAGGMAEGGTPR